MVEALLGHGAQVFWWADVDVDDNVDDDDVDVVDDDVVDDDIDEV